MPGKRSDRSDLAALYAQIPRVEAEKLDRAAFELKTPKRELITALVARYVDPRTREGLDELRALSRGIAEVQSEVPPARPERQAEARIPPISISSASEWVAGMQRLVQDFATTHNCSEPLVRVTLPGDEHVFLRKLTPGPGDNFVTLAVYQDGDAGTRVLVVRLETIQRVEILEKAPCMAASTFVFPPRRVGVGFTSRT